MDKTPVQLMELAGDSLTDVVFAEADDDTRAARQALEDFGVTVDGKIRIARPLQKVERPPIEQEWETVESVGPEAGRGLGVLDMARHIRAGGSPIATGELGLHVLDTLIAVEESATRGEFVAIESTVAPVPSLPEEFNPFEATL